MIKQKQKKEVNTSLFDIVLPKPVLIAEDDKIIQERLKNLLTELNYKSNDLIFSDTLNNALLITKDRNIAFALIDLDLPDGNGIELIRMLQQRNSNILILVISASNTKETVLTAIQAGATGYLLKERDDFEVLMSIKQILRGGLPIDPFVIQIILSTVIKQPIRIQNSPERLSVRELEVLEFVVQGLNNQDIANELGLSRYTVEAHLRNIYSKLAVDSRSKAIKTAHCLGLF